MTNPLQILSSDRWDEAVFTTYSLSLSFFEGVILDALIRSGCRRTTILADSAGVRGALQEFGARRAGQDYSVEPVAVQRGVFHPKISLLFSGDDAHCLIGSGNLTFSGWGFSLELVEHLHPSFAAEAMRDLAEFFELLSLSERVRFSAARLCESAARRLRAVLPEASHGDIRFLHNLERTISDQIAEIADDLGGAKQVTVAAPYWDNGDAISHLCERLGLDKVRVHNPPGGAVRGTLGRTWPDPEKCRVGVQPVCVDALSDPRPLHAKTFEVVCVKGAVLISGSPNATSAALHGPANVEAAIARIERDRGAFWSVSPSSFPSLIDLPAEEEVDPAEQTGILRAEFEGDVIRGHILTPWKNSHATFSFETRSGETNLGEAGIGPDGEFAITAGEFEAAAWMQGRRVLHARSKDDGLASGFVQIEAFAYIVDRAGTYARHMFAAMAGMEAPDDIKAMIAWFSEHSDRLSTLVETSRSTGPGAASEATEPQEVTISGLDPAAHPHLADAAGFTTEQRKAAGYEARFLMRLLATLRQRTAEVEPPEMGDEGEAYGERLNPNDQQARQKEHEETRLAVFEGYEMLLEALLAHNDAEPALVALDVGGYLCATLKPDADLAADWLRRILGTHALHSVTDERRPEVIAAVLLWGGYLVNSPPPQTVRRKLKTLGSRFDVVDGEPTSIKRWRTVMQDVREASAVLSAASASRTYAEQALDCRDAIETGRPLSAWNEIALDTPGIRNVIETACSTSNTRRRVIVTPTYSDICPCGKFIRLPVAEARALKFKRIARSGNCCGRVIVWAGHDD